MDPREARSLIAQHAGTGEPEREQGFVGCLRPYRGLREENFHEIMHALLVLVGSQSEDEPLDRDTTGDLWHLCHTARHWGLKPTGMLQRNNLMSAEDTAHLSEWVDVIEDTALAFVDGRSASDAGHQYGRYVVRHGSAGVPDVLVPLLAELVDRDQSGGDGIEDAAHALARFGSRGRPALPALRRALDREFTLAEPADRYTAEIHAAVRSAINAIEGSGD